MPCPLQDRRINIEQGLWDIGVKNPVRKHGVLQKKSHFEFHGIGLKANMTIPPRFSERDILAFSREIKVNYQKPSF